MLAERDAALAHEGHGREGGAIQAARYGAQRRAEKMAGVLVGEITDTKTQGDDHYSKLQNISIHPRAVAHVGAKVGCLEICQRGLKRCRRACQAGNGVHEERWQGSVQGRFGSWRWGRRPIVRTGSLEAHPAFGFELLPLASLKKPTIIATLEMKPRWLLEVDPQICDMALMECERVS